MKKALYFEKMIEGDIQCTLCPYLCPIGPSKHGPCGVRTNRRGALYTLTYGRFSSSEMIPIERLPLYHFHPGTKFLLVGTQGCNMRCPFCKSWRVSQAGTRTYFIPPEQLVDLCLEQKASGVAFGINEPILNIEYILDVSPLLHNAGLSVVMGTNGFIQSAPLFDLLSRVDALVVDIKGLSDHFYESVCGGFRKEVLNNIVTMNIKTHLEISLIIIEGKNDKEQELEEFFHWVAEIQPHPPPLHLIQYKPAFQYKEPPTNPMRMFYIQEKARRILPYVYLSNMEEREANISYCPSCKTPLIVRTKEETIMENLENGQCKGCGEEIKDFIFPS